ncbi:hypothetical protein PHLCEN_2v12820 [Hermanssonia centrifuga]|uniref:Uncharacterized protein n=1 Tax=Hermanssonia centrifuga TaxID=98765 RepID=A0A2R6NG16_9APHY|nr:hypothetical protein PHLCEN_2v12820 [Hermanssonia centrifuga]
MSSIALARAYQQSFETHPYGTLALTNGALGALGDIVAQLTQNLVRNKLCFPRVFRAESPFQIQPRRVDDHRPPYDILRTVRFFAFGVGMGPVIGRWNFFLERHFPLRPSSIRMPQGQQGKVSLKALGKRVAADQLIMAPIGLALFLGSMGVMEGRDRHHIGEKYSDLFKPLVLANWQVWPLAQV